MILNILQSVLKNGVMHSLRNKNIKFAIICGAVGGFYEMELSKITDFIFQSARQNPKDPAIYFSGDTYIDYQQLADMITLISKKLYENGVRENTRVAIVMPASAAALILFYAVTGTAIAVPLNPDYSQEELKKYLAITDAQVIIADKDIFAILQPVAESLRLPVFIIDWQRNICAFKRGNMHSLSDKGCQEREKNIAAIFLTSGTTGGSKVVPLTHTNLMIPANIYKNVFRVRRTDCAVNVIPLCHIYAVTGSVLVAAAAGCSVICLPEFNGRNFFEILKRLHINWYAAGPAVHFAVAEYAKKIQARPQDYSLRVIRSGGAPLPGNVIDTLQKHFNAVVLPGYGLTETGGLGATNLLPPVKIKTASAGMAAGVKIKIVNEAKKKLPAYQIGQIILKGPSVTTGYENQKNDVSFWDNGWFATGDLGYLDDKGYLFITGRIKDIINKGGEKISPYEVEAAFLTYPDIEEAIVFPAPHPSLGEIPMAAVVLTAHSKVTEDILKLFLRKKIAVSKIPVQITGAKKIPRSNTGKIIRSSMYEYIQKYSDEFFELKEKYDNAVPNTELMQIENRVSAIWKKILKTDAIGMDDNYFTLGGDSLSVAFLFSEIEEQFAITLPAECILTKGTIHDMAALIYQKEKKDRSFEFIVPLHISNHKNTPLFCIHALNGDAFTYRKLAECLGDAYSVYGVVFRLHSSRIQQPVQLPQLAGLYVQEIREIQPQGPYCLAGYSLGGAIAYEIARQLRQQHQKVAILALLDTRLAFTEQLVQQTFATLKNKLLQEIKVFHKTSKQLKNEFAIAKMLQYAFTHYTLAAYDGAVLYFYAELADSIYAEKSLEKLRCVADHVEVVHIHARHASLISEPAICEVAQYLKNAVKKTGN